MEHERLLIDSPVMERKKFAAKVGLSEDTIRGMVDTNALPTVKVGKHRLINIAALTYKCLDGIINNAK